MDLSASARLLIVDDDADTRRLFRIILESDGYDCVEAGSADAARAVLASTAIDLALIDVLLGDEDGVGLAQAVLAGESNTAVVMVSGVDDADLATSALALGVYGYVIKPVRRSELIVHVANALRRRELELEQRRLVADLEHRVQLRTVELEGALARAEEAEVVRSQFVQNLSHELRTPLTVILAGAGLLSRTEELDRVASIGQSIDVQGRRLLQLIERLLEVASLDEALTADHVGTVDLRGLLALLVDPARAVGRAVTVDVVGHGVVTGSQQRLTAAFGHVVDNALRFTPDHAAVAISVADDGDDTCVIRVIDHGPGIDSSIRHRIWEPFVQGDGSAVRRHGGLGVGLYVCRRVVEGHGGSVELEETPGGGVTVVVRLPVGPQHSG